LVWTLSAKCRLTRATRSIEAPEIPKKAFYLRAYDKMRGCAPKVSIPLEGKVPVGDIASFAIGSDHGGS